MRSAQENRRIEILDRKYSIAENLARLRALWRQHVMWNVCLIGRLSPTFPDDPL